MKLRRRIVSIALVPIMLFAFQMIIAPSTVSAVPDTAGAPDITRNGLRADYYARNNNIATTIDFDDYMVTTIDPAINWSDLRGLLKDRAGSYEYVTTRRTGWIKTPPGGSTATYQFSFSSNEGIRLWVNGVQLHSRWDTSYERNTTTYTNCTSTISLEPDTYYSITVDHSEGTTATNNGVVGSHQRLRWTRTNGGSPFAATIIPPEAYFLDAAFTPARITEIDTSDIGVHEPATLVMDVEHFTPNTVLKLLRSSDSRQLNPIVVPYTSLGAGKISATLPAGLAPAMYKFLAEDADPQDPAGVVRMPSKFFFTTMVNNAPRPEYPRPDYARDDVWDSLNGEWDFKIDKDNSLTGYENGIPNPDTILVPFPWQSPASGIFDEDHPAAGGWYYRTFTPTSEKYAGREIYIKFGAVDAESTLYINGQYIGFTKNGGYLPFEYNVTPYLHLDQENSIALKVYDPGTYGGTTYTSLIGKQGRNAPCGYAGTSGIWQSVIFEGRLSATQLEYFHVDPLVNNGAAVVDANMRDLTHGAVPADGSARFKLKVVGGAGKTLNVSYRFDAQIWDDDLGDYKASKGASTVAGTRQITIPADGDPYLTDFTVSVPNQQLWHPDEPNLYVGTVTLTEGAATVDKVSMHFGQRDIHNAYWETSPEEGNNRYQYILLNNRPLFIAGLLDQGFWEEGVYTAPTEEALKDDVKAMRDLGFNMMRKHLKIEDPLQYVWFDRLGMILWADMPHSTRMNLEKGQPDSGRDLFEEALIGLINRDYNNPSKMMTALFNENWGITRNASHANWIRSLHTLGKTYDTSGRLFEDISPSDANNNHLQPTDLNTFHFYVDGYTNTVNTVNGRANGLYIGSDNNFRGWTAANGGGDTQDGDPWLNSEYGGVGFPDGDYDISWCFKYMTDVLRRYQKMQGFIYTEPYDIEMERNGLLKYDRSAKIMGYDEIAYGGDMRVNDIVAPEYVGFDNAPITTLTPGGTYACNINFINWAWHDKHTGPFTLKWRVDGVDGYGNKVGTLEIPGFRGEAAIDYSPYISRTEPMSFTVPNEARFNRFAGTITVWIEDGAGQTIAKNFNNFKVIASGTTPATEQLADNSYVLRMTSPTAQGSAGSLAGTRTGYLTYHYQVPANFDADGLTSLRLLAEIAASRKMSTSNRTTWRAQTAEGYETPSDVTVTINGHPVDTVFIPDAPNDIRNILTLDPTADSAGKPTPSSAPEGFGYLIDLDLDKALIATLKEELKTSKTLTVRYEVLDTAAHKNGLRVYTDTTGRYPVSPSIVLNPSALYHREGAIEDGALLFQSPLSNANYTVSALVTGSTAVINAGYAIAVDGNSVTVTGHGVNQSAVSDAAVDKIKVTFFEEQIRVYVNDNPHNIIDVYGNALASTEVEVHGALANVKVLPETVTRQPGLALSSYIESDGIAANLQNTAAADTPVVLIVAVYDGSGKLVRTELDDTLTADTDTTLSKRFSIKPSEYPGCKFIVYAWAPNTYQPLVYRSQIN